MYPRLHSGDRVVLGTDFISVPAGTHGTVIGKDDEDTDIYTYEVAFDTGIHLSGVRVYHLKREEARV